MADSGDWQLLDTYETKKFIKEVSDPAFGGLFDGPGYDRSINAGICARFSGIWGFIEIFGRMSKKMSQTQKVTDIYVIDTHG